MREELHTEISQGTILKSDLTDRLKALLESESPE